MRRKGHHSVAGHAITHSEAQHLVAMKSIRSSYAEQNRGIFSISSILKDGRHYKCLGLDGCSDRRGDLVTMSYPFSETASESYRGSCQQYYD
jgi:hypothetical protein